LTSPPIYRTLNISNDDEFGASKDETNKGLISGLNCKVWVQFESYDDFHNAMKALCGRSLEKVQLAYLLLFFLTLHSYWYEQT
jgi:hypothetical protein